VILIDLLSHVWSQAMAFGKRLCVVKRGEHLFVVACFTASTKSRSRLFADSGLHAGASHFFSFACTEVSQPTIRTREASNGFALLRLMPSKRTLSAVTNRFTFKIARSSPKNRFRVQPLMLPIAGGSFNLNSETLLHKLSVRPQARITRPTSGAFPIQILNLFYSLSQKHFDSAQRFTPAARASRKKLAAQRI